MYPLKGLLGDSPCLKTPMRRDLSASESHHAVGTSSCSTNGNQMSTSLWGGKRDMGWEAYRAAWGGDSKRGRGDPEVGMGDDRMEIGRAHV